MCTSKATEKKYYPTLKTTDVVHSDKFALKNRVQILIQGRQAIDKKVYMKATSLVCVFCP